MRVLKGTIEGTVDTQELNNRSYLVIPVVALVEGVVHSGSSTHPELVLAEAFGRHPETWDGRPVVVDHPKSNDGTYLSASNLSVLEDSQLGFIMNSAVENGKLLVEAWIDLDHVASTGSTTVQDMWQRLENQETVEVSIGAIVYTDDTQSGTYDGKEYQGVWNIVIPDHLAILSEETGACSIEDGCGTFRTQNAGQVVIDQKQLSIARTYMSKSKTKKTVSSSPKPEVRTVRASDGGCQCTGDCACNKDGVSDAGADVTLALGETEAVQELSKHRQFAARFCFSDGQYNTDVMAVLATALKEANSDNWLISYNSEFVIYEAWKPGKGYTLYRESYISEGDHEVLLSGEPEEIIFQTSVIPVNKKPAGQESKNMSSGEDGSDPEDNEPTDNGEGSNMSGKDTKEGGGNAPTIETTSDLIELVGSDSKIGKQLASALAMADKSKKDAIKQILSADGNEFTEEILEGMDLEVLQGMQSLLNSNTDDPNGEALAEDEDEDEEEDEDEKGKAAAASSKKKKSKKKNFSAKAGARLQNSNGAPMPPKVFP